MLKRETIFGPSSLKQEKLRLLPEGASRPASLPYFFRAFGSFFLVMLIIWPRGIFLDAGGIGLNPYTGGCLFGLMTLPFLILLSVSADQRAAALLRKYWPLIFSFCILQLMNLVSSIYSESPPASYKVFYQQGIFTYSTFVIFGIYFLDDRLRIFYIKALICAAALILPTAVIEYSAQKSLFALLQVDKFAAGNSADLAQLVSVRMRDNAFRAQSTFSHPILLGQFAPAIIPLAWHIAKTDVGFLRLSALLALLSAPAAVFVSGTRSAFIILGLAIILSFILHGRNKKFALSSIFAKLALALALFALSYGILGDFFDSVIDGRTVSQVNSSYTRATEIEVGLQEFARSPFIGYGLGNSSNHTKVFGGNGAGVIDNFYLTVILEGGIILAFAWSLFFFAMTITGLSAIISLEDSYARETSKALLVMNLCIISGASMHSMLDLFPFVMVNIAYFINQVVSEKSSLPSSALNASR